MLEIILTKEDARKGLKDGIDQVANAVKITLGPMGRNCIIGRGNLPPITTKDGATVVKYIDLPNRRENIGAQWMKAVAKKTADDSGDGTTTATLFTQFLITEGMKSVDEDKMNPVQMKLGIESAVKAVVSALKKMAIPIVGDFEKMKAVATISANNDSALGDIIAKGYETVGKDGMVTVKESANELTTIETVKGTRFESGYLSPYFMTNFDKQQCELSDPYILIVDKIINRLHDIVSIADKVKSAGGTLVVIADDVQHESLAFLVGNQMKGTLQSVAVRAAWHGPRKVMHFEDLAVLTGATVISSVKGTKMENITLQMLGRADKVIVTKANTTIIGGKGKIELIEARTTSLQSQIDEATDDKDKAVLTDRLSKLNGGVAVISVGANTPGEVEEKKFRIDDAIRATKSALEEGVLPGGGTAMLRVIEEAGSVHNTNLSYNAGVDLVRRVCEVQLRQICENGGEEYNSILEKIAKPSTGNKWIGYNAKTGEAGDMMKMGVIDPMKVVRCALENAASTACMVLISDCVLVDEQVYN